MQIQSINSSINTLGCQPIKQVEFAKRKPSVNEFMQESLNDDSFYSSNDVKVLEQKYDLACRLAAYYKNKYEQLSKDGSCLA